MKWGQVFIVDRNLVTEMAPFIRAAVVRSCEEAGHSPLPDTVTVTYADPIWFGDPELDLPEGCLAARATVEVAP